MSDEALFDGFEPPRPVVEAIPEELSYGRRLTLRQREYVKQGKHPLTHGPLHPDAKDGVAGPTCGGCAFREPGAGMRSYPKCVFGDGIRATHGAATDVRAWWPACPDWKPKEES